ncbi:hypothetical protein [Cesiribacter andamanensis]|uniref:Uncharacterized protein n=1 Tax=Cesiribacter andamanensis AMV16 TaxID=1279009 RepID=M7P1F1_9BACT|nr:hypothetical protein [Cesiribacter andamanensis]EMR04444.1 hypothetical protein ADICEAN_00342 [Cesiribacter andamanensis AMV16]
MQQEKTYSSILEGLTLEGQHLAAQIFLTLPYSPYMYLAQHKLRNATYTQQEIQALAQVLLEFPERQAKTATQKAQARLERNSLATQKAKARLQLLQQIIEGLPELPSHNPSEKETQAGA